MRSVKGTEIEEFMCPTDENFVRFATDYVKDMAKCGVSIIQFDDDFRYGFLSDSPACLCDGHIAEINRITGENSTREELEKYITSGGKNKFCDAYSIREGLCNDMIDKLVEVLGNKSYSKKQISDSISIYCDLVNDQRKKQKENLLKKK